MQTAAIYSRFSTDRQDARSLEDQSRRCRRWAEAQGMAVVAEYQDAATSGATVARADLQRMLAAAGRAWRTLLVDDLSRLSRDLGDTWRLVFGDLAAAGVVVVDCTTGQRSDAPGARLVFGATALVNDTFLQLVRAETHRGLEGRALAGYHTGGRTYGYRTVPEDPPADPQRPRRVPVIDEAEAKVVRRVFVGRLTGKSTRALADELNRDGIPAPHDGGKGHKGARGWSHTTIRAMLMNRRYLGEVSWNASQWVKTPRGTRRRLVRPDGERVVRMVPELAIVDAEAFSRVAATFTKRPGRPAGSGRRWGTLFSGLVRCGQCGGAVVTVGGRPGADGRPRAQLGCGVARSRGSSVCSQRRTVGEERLRADLAELLRTLDGSPEAVEAMVRACRDELERARRQGEAGQLRMRLGEAERRAANLVASLAAAGHVPALVEALRATEAEAATLREQIAASDVPTPHPSRVVAAVAALARLVSGDDAQAARAALVEVGASWTMRADGSLDGGISFASSGGARAGFLIPAPLGRSAA